MHSLKEKENEKTSQTNGQLDDTHVQQINTHILVIVNINDNSHSSSSSSSDGKTRISWIGILCIMYNKVYKTIIYYTFIYHSTIPCVWWHKAKNSVRRLSMSNSFSLPLFSFLSLCSLFLSLSTHAPHSALLYIHGCTSLIQTDFDMDEQMFIEYIRYYINIVYYNTIYIYV